MRAFLPLIILSLALAGCASDSATADAEPELGLEQPLEATAKTGVIRGVVVDAAVVPIEGVTITIQGTEDRTLTNDKGAFGFGDLDPGTYFLEAAKAGFGTVQVSVDVVAGDPEPPVLKIALAADPSSAPYIVPEQFSGMVKCGLSYVAACGAADIVGQDVGDRFLAVFQLDRMPEHITMEAVWEGTQPTGGNFQLRLGATPAGPATVAATATGPSPQQAVANRTLIEEFGIGGANDLVGRMFVWEMEGTGIDDHTGQCVPVPTITTWCQGPGVAVDQAFELFVHSFYNFVPEDGWRFTSDGSPGVPQ